MKILVLQDDFPPHHIGGAGAIAFAFASEYQRLGHKVRVVTTVRTEREAGTTKYEGLTVHAIATAYPGRYRAYRSLYNPSSVGALEGILREFKPEIVHAHAIHTYLSYAALRAAKRSGARVVLTCHDVMTFNYTNLTGLIAPGSTAIPETVDYRARPFQQFLQQRWRYNPLRNVIIRTMLRRYVDQVVAVSGALRDALIQNKIANVAVIHNGIDVRAWQIAPEVVDAFARKHHIGPYAMLFVGRMTRAKGGEQAIEILRAVNEHMPASQLVVVGMEDEHAMHMRAKARALGVEDNAIFTGRLFGEELVAAYHATALTIVPSLCFDSFPTVILEAMASSRPVIATCLGGAREAVEGGVTGGIVNPFDVQGIAENAINLLTDEGKRTTYGEAAYKRVAHIFSLEKQARRYEELFTTLL